MSFRHLSLNRAGAMLSFTLRYTETVPKCAPRLGIVTLYRQDGCNPTLETPALVTATSRGIVPHLSQDHVLITRAIRWVQLHFESL